MGTGFNHRLWLRPPNYRLIFSSPSSTFIHELGLSILFLSFMMHEGANIIYYVVNLHGLKQNPRQPIRALVKRSKFQKRSHNLISIITKGHADLNIRARPLNVGDLILLLKKEMVQVRHKEIFPEFSRVSATVIMRTNTKVYLRQAQKTADKSSKRRFEKKNQNLCAKPLRKPSKSSVSSSRRFSKYGMLTLGCKGVMRIILFQLH